MNVVVQLVEDMEMNNTVGNQVVFCKHLECKDEITCLRYQLAVHRKIEKQELLEAFPELDMEELDF